MKFIIDNWMLLSVALISGGMLLWPSLKGASGSSLTAAGAVQLINREKGVLIDVSEPDEFAAAHAAGARNVPLGQLQDKLAQTVKNKDLPLIMMCPKGARASKAVPIARQLGYTQVQALAGGTGAWREANLPVENTASAG